MITLGIDVSKQTLAVAAWQQERAVAWPPVTNTPDGWVQLAAQVPAQETVRLVLEPSGGYELPLALWAHQRGWQVVRPNPRAVRDWARSQGHRAKTDRQDALVLARFGTQVNVPLWQPLAQEVSELDQLLRWRADIQTHLQQARTRQQQILAHPQQHPAVIKGSEQRITALEEEQAACEQAIRDHLAQHPAMQQQATVLRSVPGIGAKNVLPVLVLLSRWDTLTGGQGTSKGLVALVGLDPTPQESGTSVWHHPHISRQGDREIRRLLYMGALGALRCVSGVVRQGYERLVGRGKAKRLALVASARKILTWAWAVFHSGLPFDPVKAGLVI